MRRLRTRASGSREKKTREERGRKVDRGGNTDGCTTSVDPLEKWRRTLKTPAARPQKGQAEAGEKTRGTLAQCRRQIRKEEEEGKKDERKKNRETKQGRGCADWRPGQRRKGMWRVQGRRRREGPERREKGEEKAEDGSEEEMARRRRTRAEWQQRQRKSVVVGVVVGVGVGVEKKKV